MLIMYLKNINHTYFLLCIQKIYNVFPPYKKLAYNSVLTKLLTIFIKNVQQVPKQCFKCIQIFYYAYKKVHIIIYAVFDKNNLINYLNNVLRVQKMF